MKSGIVLIAEERQEQIEKHGRSIAQDVALNKYGQLICAARQMIRPDNDRDSIGKALGARGFEPPLNWDFKIFSKMISKPYKERLVIAGALIAAEIDRLLNSEQGVHECDASKADSSTVRREHHLHDATKMIAPPSEDTREEDFDEMNRDELQVALEKKTAESKEWCKKAMEAANQRRESQEELERLKKELEEANDTIKILEEHDKAACQVYEETLGQLSIAKEALEKIAVHPNNDYNGKIAYEALSQINKGEPGK